MNTNTAKKNLILGLVKDYSSQQIEPFLKSLKQSGYQGDVCFFTSELNQDTLSMLGNYKVDVVPFDYPSLSLPFIKKRFYSFHLFYLYPFQRTVPLADLFKFFNKNLTPADLAQTFTPLLNLYASRFLMYYLYLLHHSNYDNVMITDVRDVFFQDDPFNFNFGDEICCFLEDSDKKIRGCSYNSIWIGKGYSEDVLNELGDELITCAAVSIGSYSAMLSYLEILVTRLIRHPFLKYGIDQSVHNYIVYKGIAKNVKLFENHHGPVLTMGYTPSEKMKFDSQGRMLNDDGSPINVIHQYDRHPDVEEKLMSQIN